MLLSTEKSHFAFLDVLRTAAIVLVLLRHSIRPFMPEANIESEVYENLFWPIKNFMVNGWIGVDLFFILSGFLIAQSFLLQEKPSFKKFYKKRALRIFPAYFAVLFLILIGFFPGYTYQTSQFGWDLFYHITFLQDYTGSNFNVVFWSLGVEVKFYLCAPFILYFLRKYVLQEKWAGAYALLFLIIIGGVCLKFICYQIYGPFNSYYDFWRIMRSPFHACFDGLFMGVFVAVAYKHINVLDKKELLEKYQKLLFGVFWLTCLVFFASMASHSFLKEITLYDGVFQTFLMTFLFSILTLSGLCCHALAKSSFVSKWGSRLSYSLYLVHWPLIPLCLSLTIGLGFTDFYNDFVGFAIFTSLLWVISTALACLLYLYIEKPFLKLK